jgi:hypothetical protein
MAGAFPIAADGSMDQADPALQYPLPMPQARCNQISLEATSTYHCISRCVRR